MDRSAIHDMFRLKVTSGFAFSANQWIATLVRHYDRNSLMDQQFHQSTEPKDDRGIVHAKILCLFSRIRKFHAWRSDE